MNRIARNAVWIIASKIVQSLLSLVVGMLSARYLGPSNYGLITYAASLTAFALPFAQLGFNNILVHELVEKPELEGETLGTAMVFNAASAFLCMLGIAAFTAVANPNEPITFCVCILYSLNLLIQSLDLITYWFQAKLLSKYSSVISLLAYVLVSAYKIFLLIAHKSIFWFAVTASIDSLVIGVASLAVYYKVGGRKLSLNYKNGQLMFSKSRYYIISSMMVTVFCQTDRIMLKIMIDEAATGYYGAAITCASSTWFIYPAIIDSFRPAIFEAKKNDMQIFERRLAMLYSIIIYISLLHSALIALFAPLIVRILYGDAYLPAQSALRIAVWYVTFSYLGSVRNIWILANNQQRHLWKINLCGALANVFLNLLLIPQMGINGAALASLCTQFFTNVVVGFIFPPIRENNRIMLMGCNPSYLVEAFKSLSKKR